LALRCSHAVFSAYAATPHRWRGATIRRGGLFSRRIDTWTQRGGKLVRRAAGHANQAYSFSLSAIVRRAFDAGNAGAAWYAMPGPSRAPVHRALMSQSVPRCRITIVKELKSRGIIWWRGTAAARYPEPRRSAAPS
jgi:hypothetical protein